MFKWLFNLVDDVRIAFDYNQYETECKAQWVAEAERKYSTAHLEMDINVRMAEPLRHILITFELPIRDLESQYKHIQIAVEEAREKLAILERDYKSELDAAYSLQHEISGELEECRRRLSSAYDDLNSAKSSLNSWYSRAEGNWIGNGGKKLPNHAFFGQDLSDRDCYKSRRDSAAHDISRFKSDRARISSRLDDARSSVKSIKDARQAMFDLKKAGFDKRIVNGVIRTGNKDMLIIKKKIDCLTQAQREYLHQAKLSLGVNVLEGEINQLRLERDNRIRAFDSDDMVLERKAKHRTMWLAEHGK